MHDPRSHEAVDQWHERRVEPAAFAARCLFHHAVHTPQGTSKTRASLRERWLTARAEALQRAAIRSYNPQIAVVRTSENGPTRRSRDVRFSNRPFEVKHFQTIATAVSMSLTGSRFSSESAPGPLYGASFVKKF